MTISLLSLDSKIRIAAFEWLSEQVDIHGDVLPRTLLQKGFVYNGKLIPLVSPQGIFKPQELEIPLTITTTPRGPYNDSYKDGFLEYKYRGSNPDHRDNVGLREAYKKNIPLIYFHGIMPGKYVAVWPVYIAGDDPKNLTFNVSVDDQSSIRALTGEIPEEFAVYDERTEARRQYITAAVRKRLHQRGFREKVLRAYREQCSLCRLRHLELLDAAHIISDREPEGEPIINNGIALCKLHHAAFDSFLIGITPDYNIQVRNDILEEEDGPMLQHALKELHNQKIILPVSKYNWPDQILLEQRFNKFRCAV